MANTNIIIQPATLTVIVAVRPPCKDLDDDCKYVEDKQICSNYDPNGYCPFLIGAANG